MTRIEEIEARSAACTLGTIACLHAYATRIQAYHSDIAADFIAGAFAISDRSDLLAEVKRMREALSTARGQIVGFSIKEIGAEAAVQNVKYIDDLLALTSEKVKP